MKVLITRRVPEEAVRKLKSHFSVAHHDSSTTIARSRLLRAVRDIDGLLCLLTEKVNGELLDAAPKLKIVATATVGVDHIDLAQATKRDIPVTHTPGVLTETCADFTWALLLASARRVVEGDRFMRAGKFKGWDMLMFLGTDVYGKTLGIVGFGRIGQGVARRAKGFGMKILYYDKIRAGLDTEQELNAEFVNFDRLIQESDFITLHTVLDETTRHLIGKSEFKKMKKSAYLVNASRGPIVDEKALVATLKSGVIRGAALDVYEFEPKMVSGLSRLPNVVLAPHLSSASRETRKKMALLAAESLIDYLIFKKNPRYLANPECVSLSRPTPLRAA
ncbi:MAG: D-glycerate dehydrogenase [Elusimicrobia bacterium]|nr:D-glycerate dehydrogenase [Elusimicrobiota bacterium]